ncbi:unnamed protein product (macronuclear) [Paramecium tetraurelia]|uniref:Transmembrane protein n=1 Tax=Paramecium tetraurelia TaxID=5888 RepID=A0DGD3_PARTE|nr:uncharacterized protein GSPATT00002229001 [Paramecium tetraurelia]CAK82100.1 unnamed protein product [Paramecium tetraurelia]|eukprot:XP_001449497.1 hypothetical protein (macronuclear) [Paramecium tetraurelia strain d4-2]
MLENSGVNKSRKILKNVVYVRITDLGVSRYIAMIMLKIKNGEVQIESYIFALITLQTFITYVQNNKLNLQRSQDKSDSRYISIQIKKIRSQSNRTLCFLEETQWRVLIYQYDAQFNGCDLNNFTYTSEPIKQQLNYINY